jgi:hypothetical protein
MDDNAGGLHKRCGPTAFFVIFAKKSGARLFNRHIAQAVGGGYNKFGRKATKYKTGGKNHAKKKIAPASRGGGRGPEHGGISFRPGICGRL